MAIEDVLRGQERCSEEVELELRSKKRVSLTGKSEEETEVRTRRELFVKGEQGQSGCVREGLRAQCLETRPH